MKKLLVSVKGCLDHSGTYVPLGWLVMPISDACVNVVGLINKGAGMSMSTWRQVYSTLAKELTKSHWQPVYKNPFKIDGIGGVRILNFDKIIQGPVQVTAFMVMDEREYYLRCDKIEDNNYEQNM